MKTWVITSPSDIQKHVEAGYQDFIVVEPPFITIEGSCREVNERIFQLGRAVTEQKVRNIFNEFVDWIHSVTGNAMLLSPFKSPYFDLFIWGRRKGLFECGILFTEPLGKLNSADYQMISAADVLSFASEDIEQQFRNKYLIGYRRIQYGRSYIDNSSNVSPRCLAEEFGDNKLKVLIVAYYAGSARTVGVQRVNYWFENIAEISGGRVACQLLTSVRSTETSQDVHFVGDDLAAVLVDREGLPYAWSESALSQEAEYKKNFSTIGYFWRHKCEEYFEDRNDHFDVVVVSGNPFAVFDFAAFAQEKWWAKTILDYRDPFANNPRMKYSQSQRDFIRSVERGLNFQADLITVVNPECRRLAEVDSYRDIAVIPNGFDERIVSTVEPRSSRSRKIEFVHAGSFYSYGSPEAFINCLNQDKHVLRSIGGSLNSELVDGERVLDLGRVDYEDALSIIAACDCGIVFLSKSGFETPTKMYDYAAYGLDILFICEEELDLDVREEIRDGYEAAFFVKNCHHDIEKFLSNYVQRKDRKSYSPWSRKASTRLLIEHMNKLVAG